MITTCAPDLIGRFFPVVTVKRFCDFKRQFARTLIFLKGALRVRAELNLADMVFRALFQF